MARNDLTMRKLRLIARGYKRREYQITVLNTQPRYTEYVVKLYFFAWHIRVDGGKVWCLGGWAFCRDYVPGKMLLGILRH